MPFVGILGSSICTYLTCIHGKHQSVVLIVQLTARITCAAVCGTVIIHRNKCIVGTSNTIDKVLLLLYISSGIVVLIVPSLSLIVFYYDTSMSVIYCY